MFYRNIIIFLATTAFVATAAAAASRTWITLVDPEAFRIEDRGRSLIQENDPFLTRTTWRPTATPTTYYTESPILRPSSSAPSPNPTTPPTTTTSASPSDLLSMEPSSHEEFWNTYCTEAEVLHQVVMKDSFGDGWDDRELVITRIGDDETAETVVTEKMSDAFYMQTRTVTHGDGTVEFSKLKFNNSTLPAKTEILLDTITAGPLLTPNPLFQKSLAGAEEIGYVCLQPRRCYHASLPGGRWSNEIQWEIRPVVSGVNDNTNETASNPITIVNGGSPSNCNFAFNEVNDTTAGTTTCPNGCHIPGQSPLRPSSVSISPVTAPSLPKGAPTPSLNVPTRVTSKTPSLADIFSFPVLDSIPLFPEDGWSCPEAEVLYEVVLRDEFGDGSWGDRELIIERLGDDEKTETVVTTALAESSFYLEIKTVTYGDGGTSIVTKRYDNSTSPVDAEILMENSDPGPILTPNPVFKRGLADGEQAEVSFICLQRGRCYHALLRSGGIWAGEMQWEIRSALTKSPMVNGGSPSNCLFAAADGGTENARCPTQCHLPGQSPLLRP